MGVSGDNGRPARLSHLWPMAGRWYAAYGVLEHVKRPITENADGCTCPCPTLGGNRRPMPFDPKSCYFFILLYLQG